MGHEARALLLVAPGTPEERPVPIWDRLFAGRECSGVDESRRVLIEDPEVSRHHLEIRLDGDRAWLIDLSTNGTRLNGVRVERAVSTPLHEGDRITVGSIELEFRFLPPADVLGVGYAPTLRRFTRTDLAVVVGDVVGYTRLTAQVGNEALISILGLTFDTLRESLQRHGGNVANIVGDAFFAVWERDRAPDALRSAISFALDGRRALQELAIETRVSDAPVLRMGWGVTCGEAAIGALTSSLVHVVGEPANLAFRLSTVAGRADRPEVLTTAPVHQATKALFSFKGPFEVAIKGRDNPETVYGIERRSA